MTHAVIRPRVVRWFLPVWIEREVVHRVYAGPWTSVAMGGVRFDSDDPRLGRIGFWPMAGVAVEGRDRMLKSLDNLGWPVDT